MPEAMKEKTILLKRVNEAIESDKTSYENKKLLSEFKILLENSELKPLSSDHDKKEYLNNSLTVAKLIEIIIRIFTGSG